MRSARTCAVVSKRISIRKALAAVAIATTTCRAYSRLGCLQISCRAECAPHNTGHAMDIEDEAVGSKLDSFLSTSTGHATSNFGGGGGSRLGGGNGGVGGGAGGSRAGTCYNCGQEGHWASNCPMSQGPRGGAGRGTAGRGGGMGGGGGNGGGGGVIGGGGQVCFKCNLPGHYANSCPNNQQLSGQQDRGSLGGHGMSNGRGSAGSSGCFKCGEMGHWSSNCPGAGGMNAKGGRGGGGRGRGTGGVGRGGRKKK